MSAALISRKGEVRLQFFNGMKGRLILDALVLIFAIWGMSRKNFDHEEASLFQSMMMEVAGPIQGSITEGREAFSGFFDHYVFLSAVSEQNNKLKNELSNLQSEVFRLQQLEKENLRLKELLGFGEDLNYRKVLAQVVAWDSSGQYRMLRVNKGSRHGIRTNASVVTASGLVGHVYRVGTDYSDVLTILDPNSRVDVLVDSTRSYGILEGYTQFRGLMKYVPRSEPITLNDIVITAGLGDIYPKGIKVGAISRIERESYGITQVIEITPAVDFQRLEELVVLVNDHPASFSDFDVKPEGGT